MDDSNKTYLPDISGVFDIDEKNIPDSVIEREEEISKPADYEPIMLTGEDIKDNSKAELKRLKAQKRAEKKAQKRKMKRIMLIKIFSIVAAVAILAFGIKAAVDNSKKPVCEVARSYTGKITAHYDTKAVVTSEAIGADLIKTTAIFSENDYDIYSLTKGLPAELSFENSKTLSGELTSIERYTADDAIFQKVRENFPDGEYSSGVNYIVTLSVNSSEMFSQDIIADVKIITAQADNTVLVPSSAVHKDGTRFYVWIYKSFGKKAVKQEVSVGIEADGVSEITKGLKTDTKIITSFSCSDDALSDVMKIKLPKN